MQNKKASAIVKRDTTENWLKAVNYIPEVGTIIIMDNADGSVKLKFGDGVKLVNDLPDLLEITKNKPKMSEEDDELLEL